MRRSARRRARVAVRSRRDGVGRRRGPGGQRGVALAIGLVLLVVMSIVAASTLSGTRLNEKITSNAQQKAIAFEAAESAIEAARGVDVRALLGQEGVALNEPRPITLTAVTERFSSGLDQSRDGDTTVDVEADVTVRYCGEGPPTEGTEMSADLAQAPLVGMLYDVNGVAAVDASATRADHVLRQKRNVPRTGRTGACTTPGI